MRYAIIGCAAGIVPTHLRALAQLPSAQIVGMADISAERGAARAAEAGSPFFADHRALLAEQRPDIAVICTPHPYHASSALDCFAAGAQWKARWIMRLSVTSWATSEADADRSVAAIIGAWRSVQAEAK